MDIAAIGSLVPLKNINGINTKNSPAGVVQGNGSEGFERQMISLMQQNRKK